MRHALSTYLFVEQRLTVALLDRILRSGVKEVEIFCARQHIDYHNRAQIDELKHWFRDAELKVHSIHAPMFSDDIWGRTGPNSVVSITETPKAKRIAATDEIKRAMAMAEVIPFRYLVQHIGTADDEYDEHKIEAAFNCLDELIVFGSQLGVEILVENIPNALSSAEGLNRFVRSSHLRVGYCFDTGHAHLGSGIEPEFELMKHRIRSTHVHDNDGQDDAHIFPLVGSGGTIDWQSTIELLRSLGDDVPLLVELRNVPEMAKPLEKVQESFDRLENV